MPSKALMTLSLLLALVTSCKVYRSQFDCCPGQGVPCASVTDIEGMIIETQEGPDIFPLNSQIIPQPDVDISDFPAGHRRRIWIADSISCDGHRVCGHYMYLNNQ